MVGTIHPRNRDKIISTVNAPMKRTKHKYGVVVPWLAEEDYTLDTKNGNTLWWDALDKEMYNLQVAFDIMDTYCNPPPGWSKASGHINFFVRITLERKAWRVKDGHITPEPKNYT